MTSAHNTSAVPPGPGAQQQALDNQIAALTAEKQRLANILWATGLGTWEWHVQTGEVRFNERWAELIGYTLAELAPISIATWTQLTHAEDLAASGKALADHFAGITETYEVEVRMRHKAGHWIWVQVRGRLISRTPDGKPEWMAGTHLDITRHKLAEDALRDSEAFMQDILNSVQSEIAVIDPHGTILAVNQTWQDFALANSPQPGCQAPYTEVGTNYLQVCGGAKEDAREAMEGITSVLEGRSPHFSLEYPCDAPDVKRWFSMRVSPLGGNRKGAVIAHSDITERKMAEEAAMASEVNFRSYYNCINDFLFVLDAQGKLLYTNDYVLSRLDYKSDELLGKSALMLHPTAQREEARRTLGDMLVGQATHCPVPLQARDGQQIPVETRVAPGQWNGQPALFGWSHDISDRIALARSNAELEQFAYVASHDLRQPLRMVNSYVQLLERRLADKLDDDTREMMHYATDGARRMDQMLVSLLEYSRVGRKGEPMQAQASRGAVDEALHFLAPAIQEACADVAVSGDWPQVLASRDELTRLWQNLVGNALKYRAPDTTPHITVSVAPESESTWRFCVADNGIGIDPAQFDRLFKMFQRLHTREQYEGNGVGLAIARKIVERHGGRIWVESSGAGQGSRFCFTLPALQSETFLQP